MRNYFTFGQYDSRDFGIYISGSGIYNSPKRVYNTYTVPGRNGDLIGKSDRLENVSLTYPAFSYANFDQNIAALRSALLSTMGYARLWDSYHPDEFRMGYFTGPLTVKARDQLDAGEYDLKFDCKPQRFLISGETVKTFTSSSGTITNPTLFGSRPLIRVTGYGTLTIGSDVITIAQAYAYVDIDSEIQDCYHGTDNANGQVTLQQNDFPELKPGTNNIVYSGSITKVEITPRWYIV